MPMLILVSETRYWSIIVGLPLKKIRSSIPRTGLPWSPMNLNSLELRVPQGMKELKSVTLIKSVYKTLSNK